MIASPKPTPKQSAPPAWQKTFLKLLPTIQSYAKAAFAHLDPDAQEEAVAEAVAHAMIAIIGLVKRGKNPAAFPSPRREKRIAERLAVGDPPGLVAKKFRLSPSRIWQLRRNLRQNWEEFQGEDAAMDLLSVGRQEAVGNEASELQGGDDREEQGRFVLEVADSAIPGGWSQADPARQG